MLTFLRKIRKSLISSGDSRKYILYAIGEILLVMIGILLAMQVNNWNESRKTGKEDLIFLENLKNELAIDTAVLKTRRSYYLGVNDALKESLEIFEKQSSISPDDQRVIAFSLTDLEVLTPAHKNITRNDMKLVQGALDRIDSELNYEYLSYLELIQSNNIIITKLGETLQLLSLNYVLPIIDIKAITYSSTKERNVEFDFTELRSNREIKNSFAKSIAYRQVSIRYMSDQIEMAENILILVDQIRNNEGL